MTCVGLVLTHNIYQFISSGRISLLTETEPGAISCSDGSEEVSGHEAAVTGGLG